MIVSRTELKSYFEEGDVPTADQFINLIDTLLEDNSGARIKIAYESEDDTNVLTDLLNTAIGLNTTHRSSNGNDHSAVVLNNTHRGVTTGNPHNVSASDVGLGNVENTSDANKPVSTDQQTEIDTKEDTGVAQGIMDTHETTHPVPTNRDTRNQVVGDYEPEKGSDDNYVTNAEKVVIGNTSNTNTGDQTISDETIIITDNITNDVSSSKHGFAPKGDGVTTSFLNGLGAYSTPSGGGNVSTFGSPVNNDFARFVNGTDIEGRSYAEVRSDLNIEDGATADQSDEEIKTAYENNDDTNAYNDSEKAEVGVNTAHSASDGTDHSEVVQNTSDISNLQVTPSVIAPSDNIVFTSPSGTMTTDANRDILSIGGIGYRNSALFSLVGTGSLTFENCTGFVDQGTFTKVNGQFDVLIFNVAEDTTPAYRIFDMNREPSQVAAVALNTTHRTSTGEDHSYIDQSVISGATPTFTNTNFTEATNKNYVTNAEKVVIGNTSNTNTGDQDLSAFALKSNVLELDNTDAFTPTADYHPATMKYVDDNAGGTVDISGTPVANDFARFTDADTIEGRSYAEVRSDLNIEDGADVTDTSNVTAAGALMDSELTSITAVKALDQGVATGDSPEFQNIVAEGAGGISSSTVVSAKNLDDGSGHEGGLISLVSENWGEASLNLGSDKALFWAGSKTNIRMSSQGLAFTDSFEGVQFHVDIVGDVVKSGSITSLEKSADPADPAEGSYVRWMSDGTEFGEDGDICIKITAGGSTKTAIWIDFSTL